MIEEVFRILAPVTIIPYFTSERTASTYHERNSQVTIIESGDSVPDSIAMSVGIFDCYQIRTFRGLSGIRDCTVKVSSSLCFVASWTQSLHWQLSLEGVRTKKILVEEISVSSPKPYIRSIV